MQFQLNILKNWYFLFHFLFVSQPLRASESKARSFLRERRPIEDATLQLTHVRSCDGDSVGLHVPGGEGEVVKDGAVGDG